MKTTKVFLAAAFAIVIMAGCEDEGTEQTPEEIITGTPWKVTAHTETDSAGTVTDIYATLGNCRNDDKIIFQDDSLFIADEGATKCDSIDPQQEIGTWSLNSNATAYTTIIDLDTIEHTLLELTETRIRSTYVDIGRLTTVTLEPY